MTVEIGTVVHFEKNRGYGFIRTDGGGGDVFFHRSGGRRIAIQDGIPSLTDEPVPRTEVDDVSVGTHVFFDRGTLPNGRKGASRWGMADKTETAMLTFFIERIAARAASKGQGGVEKITLTLPTATIEVVVRHRAPRSSFEFHSA